MVNVNWYYILQLYVPFKQIISINIIDILINIIDIIYHNCILYFNTIVSTILILQLTYILIVRFSIDIYFNCTSRYS